MDFTGSVRQQLDAEERIARWSFAWITGALVGLSTLMVCWGLGASMMLANGIGLLTATTVAGCAAGVRRLMDE